MGLHRVVNGSYRLLQDWTANQVGKPKPPLHKLHQKCSEAPTRRTNRTNAGRHHNLHHQPQAAGSRAIGATNSQVPRPSTLFMFRPWHMALSLLWLETIFRISPCDRVTFMLTPKSVMVHLLLFWPCFALTYCFV
ncbi:unnamed protein product [Boreogadus saida]